MAADRREGQPGLVERGVGIGNRVDALEIVEASKPLPLRVQLVELERKEAGQLVEPVEKLAHAIDRAEDRGRFDAVLEKLGLTRPASAVAKNRDDVHAAAAVEEAALTDAEIVRRSFFPMTFPLTTGPGTIAASIALSAQIPTRPILSYLVGAFALAGGAALVSLVLYFLFGNAASVLRRLGEIGTLVMMRLMAFILLCIGIQIMWTGWAELNGMKP